jgi:hypothetical protein
MTNLHRRLKKLEAVLTDVTGLTPHTGKWLEHWRRWLDRTVHDPDFRPTETMPLEAARTLIQSGPSDEDEWE